jgi:hypothetical protein
MAPPQDTEEDFSGTVGTYHSTREAQAIEPTGTPAADTEQEKLRAGLLPLALGTVPLTIPEVLATLDAVRPVKKRSRTISAAPGDFHRRSMPLPKFILSGQYLEEAGFRIGKKVTVRTAPDLILITVDNPGPDPAIDAKYEALQNGRWKMWDIVDRFVGSHPQRLAEMEEAAKQKDAEREAYKKQQKNRKREPQRPTQAI